MNTLFEFFNIQKMRGPNRIRGGVNWFIDYFGRIIHTNIKLNETILVCGPPRGGTTWLMEILETMPGYKSIFEPFHRDWFPIGREVELESRPYIAAGEEFPELKEYLGRVFTGEIAGLNPWFLPTPQSMYQRLSAKKIIVKFIRANRMIPWMVRNFPIRGLFFIIRHPCATISSQIENDIFGYSLRSDTSIPKEIILKEVVLKEAENIPHVGNNQKLLGKIKTIEYLEEVLALAWSLDICIPLLFSKPFPWKTIIFEKLVTDGECETKSIFDAINEQLPDEALRKLKKSSGTTIDKPGKGSAHELTRWHERLTNLQIKNILEVVSWFGLDFYDDGPEPDYNRLEKIVNDTNGRCVDL